MVASAVLVAATAAAGPILSGRLAGSGGGPLTTAGSGGAPTAPAAVHVHVVQPGESLWSIVRSSGARGDPRPIVDRLETEVDHQPLQVGERLVLP
jgi:hypothetical protein